MKAMRLVGGLAYEIGEEVVVRLAGIEAWALDAGAAVAPERLPPWTIGEVCGRVRRDRRTMYAVRFRRGHSTCICAVDAGAIEGTA
jgi:hypothetical protein